MQLRVEVHAGDGIYHVGLRATDSSVRGIPVSIDQYGATVDGQFTLIIDSCSDPDDDVPDVDALLDVGDGLCAVAVGDWDSDAADVAAKVLAAVESSPTLAVDPVPVDAIDASDWAATRGLAIQGKSAANGLLPAIRDGLGPHRNKVSAEMSKHSRCSLTVKTSTRTSPGTPPRW